MTEGLMINEKEWKITGLGEERKGKKSGQGRKEGKRKDTHTDRHTYSQLTY